MNAHFAGKRHVYDAVNIIHDVITIRNPFPYTAKFMFVGIRNHGGESRDTTTTTMTDI